MASPVQVPDNQLLQQASYQGHREQGSLPLSALASALCSMLAGSRQLVLVNARLQGPKMAVLVPFDSRGRKWLNLAPVSIISCTGM